MDNTTCIEVKNLTVRTGNRIILNDVTLRIPKNQVTVIIGPSGCGKSTLLRCMNRLTDEEPSLQVSGEISYEGRDILGDTIEVCELRRSIGMIQQSPVSLPMSIADNIRYGPRIHGIRDKKRLDEIIQKTLNQVGLWDETHEILDEPACNLSIGQQQRLALARTLSVGSRVLLCDEVTSSLDPVSARKVEEELIALKEEYTVIFVTHILRQAKRMADNVVFLYLGEVVETGKTEEIFTHPRDIRTEEYIRGVFG